MGFALPLSGFVWTSLFAFGAALAGFGYEFRQRPIYKDMTHWTNDIAYSIMISGRVVVFICVALALAKQVVI